METKVKIIQRVEQGDKTVDISHACNKELTNEDLMQLEAQREDKERQEEEETEEPMKFTMQEMARGLSLLEEGLLVFETQDLNTEQHSEVAATIQNAIQCYSAIYDEKKRKRSTTQTSLDPFYKTVDRNESNKEGTRTTSGMREIATFPPSPIADDPSALPSPTSSPSSSS